jgi:phosphoglycolate phosphatase
MPVPILIFDLDGTLTDPREGILRCLRHALTSVGVPIPEPAELEHWIGPPLQGVLVSELGDRMGAQALENFRNRYGAVGLYENRLYPGIVDALEILKQLSPALFVATSKPQSFAKRIIEHFRLSEAFREVYGSELNGERADKTELLSYLLEQEKLLPAQAIMIGDRKYDIAAANAVGLRSIAVTWGYGSVEELSEAGADAICDSASALVALLRGGVLARQESAS